MKILEQKREELIAKIETSGMRTDAKNEVLTLLSKEELSDEEMGQVLRAIQGDIERDLEEVPGLTEFVEADEEYQALVAKQEAELAEIEKTVKESAEFLESQATELEALDAEITQVEDAEKLDSVKGKLGME